VVYRWINLDNNKSYVGSGVDLSKRLSDYYSNQNIETQLKKSKSAIYSAILKYGRNNFKLEILEYCESAIVLKREQYYINLLAPEYNILPTAGSLMGYKLSDKTKNKMSVAQKGNKNRLGKNHSKEAIIKMSEAHIGKILSDKTRAKLSIVKTGKNNSMFGVTHSEETKAKMSAANGTPIVVLNTETGETSSYTSGRAAAVALSSNITTVSRYLKSGKLFKGIYKITKNESGN